MRFGVNIRIDAKSGFGIFAICTGEFDEVLKLGFRFDVKITYAGIQRLNNFLIGFADAGVDDFFHVAARLLDPEEFSAADNIKTAAGLGECFKDMNIAACLDGIADGGIKFAIGFLNFIKMLQKCGLTIYVRRRTNLGSYLMYIDIFSEEYPISISKVIHCMIPKK